MITDFEGFPKSLYQESGSAWIENVYTWLNLEDHEKDSFEFLLEQGYEIDQAIEKCEDLCMYEYNTHSDIYDIFEMFYPEAEEQERQNPYLTIDYNSFKDTFTEFESETGNCYLVDADSV